MTEAQPIRRLTDYLEQYWHSKRNGKAFPALSDIDMNELESEFRRDSFLVELIPTISMSIVKMIYLGDGLNSEYKKDESGIHIKNLVVQFLETPMDAYNKVVKSKKPLAQNVEIPGSERTTIKYRQILLPIGDNEKGAVTHILGGMRYKKI